MTVGALPHIAPVSYYVAGETVFFEVGGSHLHNNVAGNVVAFESGATEVEGSRVLWSVCAVGVALPTDEVPVGEPVLCLHPELLQGWIESSSEPSDTPAGP